MKLRSLVGLWLLAAFAGSASVGCSARTTVGDDGAAGASGSPSSSGASGSSGNTQIVGASGGPPAVLDLSPPTDTCPATCDDPAGTVQSIASAEQLYARLVGRWLICSGRAGTFLGPSDVVGVEYAAPTLVDTPNQGQLWQGNMYYLVAGAKGPERGKGFGYQLTYDTTPQTSSEGPPNRINMHPSPTASFVALFQYSPCPKEWLITDEAAADGGALIVPAD